MARSTHPLEPYLGYQLRRAALHMQADLAARIGALGLTMVEMSVLLVVEANPGIIQSKIGEMLGIKRPNMAPLAAGLIARGLIGARPIDGRSSGLSLTPAGVEMAARVRDCADANDAVLFAQVPPQERRRLVELVRAVWAQRTATE